MRISLITLVGILFVLTPIVLNSTIISIRVLSNGPQKIVLFGDVHATWDAAVTEAQANALAKECARLSGVLLYEGNFPSPFALHRTIVPTIAHTAIELLELLENNTVQYSNARNIETRVNGPTEDDIALFAAAVSAHSVGMLDMQDAATAEWIAHTRTHQYTLYMLNRHHWRVIQLLKKNIRSHKKSVFKTIAEKKVAQLANSIKNLYAKTHEHIENKYKISRDRLAEILQLPPAAVWDLPPAEQGAYAEFAHTVATSVSFTFDALDANALLNIPPTETTLVVVGEEHAVSITEELRKVGFSLKIINPVKLTNGEEYPSFEAACDAHIPQAPDIEPLTIPEKPVTIQNLRDTIYYAPGETEFCATMLCAVTPAQIHAAVR